MITRYPTVDYILHMLFGCDCDCDCDPLEPDESEIGLAIHENDASGEGCFGKAMFNTVMVYV